jgi:hypothetical protein
MKRMFVASTALVILLTFAGCGGSGPFSGTLYPVTGQVVLADGKPLTGGSVRFIPKLSGLPATGKIGPDGTFSLTTKTHEGAAPGEYKVRIEPSAEMVSKKGGAVKKLPFAAKYRNYEGDSGLTSTVEAGPTRLEPFKLEAN